MDERLTERLRALSASLDLPEHRSVAGRVLADPRLRTAPGRRAWVAATAAAAGALTVILLVPGPRDAIASLLGIGGVSVTIVDELPRAELLQHPPGQVVDLGEAAGLATFDIRVLDTSPDQVIVDLDAPVSLVTLVYADRLIITQMATPLDAVFLEKSVEASAVVQEVTVGGSRGLWIEGAHTLTYLDGSGRIRALPPRLVASTLLYQDEGVTIRIETAGTLDDALAVAAALR